MKRSDSRLSSRTLLYMLGSLIVGGVIGGITGVLIFISVVGGDGSASATIAAPTLSLDATAESAPAEFEFPPAATLVQIANEVEALAQTDISAAATALD